MAKKRIVTPYGSIKKLAERHGVSSNYVSLCLRGAYNTPRAEAIRADAKKM